MKIESTKSFVQEQKIVETQERIILNQRFNQKDIKMKYIISVRK